jgi:hypothetical protein
MKHVLIGAAVAAAIPLAPLRAQVPAEINEPDATIVAIYHAEGIQLYECSIGKDGKRVWAFREPVATLISHQNLTVGHHVAGPRWELDDGSSVGGRPVARAPGKTPDDIPWLKLEAINHRGDGKLEHVDVIQRINTKGGMAAGPCDDAGQFRAVPYSADYTFLRKS